MDYPVRIEHFQGEEWPITSDTGASTIIRESLPWVVVWRSGTIASYSEDSYRKMMCRLPQPGDSYDELTSLIRETVRGEVDTQLRLAIDALKRH